jgi:hypothetical protein
MKWVVPVTSKRIGTLHELSPPIFFELDSNVINLCDTFNRILVCMKYVVSFIEEDGNVILSVSFIYLSSIIVLILAVALKRI